MFPTYTTVVKTIFTQVISNHFAKVLDNARKVKMHAEFVSAVKVLIPNTISAHFDIDNIRAGARVVIDLNTTDNFTVHVYADFETQEVTVSC